MTREQACDLWRFMLGVDRSAWPRGDTVIGAGHAFLPTATQDLILDHFRRMSDYNRLLLTTTFVEMLRYVMAEVSNLMHQGTLTGRLEEGEVVEVTLDPSDEEPDPEHDGSTLMQRYIRNGPAAANEERWVRAVMRLQKELGSQPKVIRNANIRRVRQALPACEPWSEPEGRREQLRALLVAMTAEDAGEGTADNMWLASWSNELEHFLPGTAFNLGVLPASEPVAVESDSGPTIIEEGHREVEVTQPDAVLDDPTNEQEALREQECMLLQQQAADFQRWERDLLRRELAKKESPAKKARTCCRGSGGRLRKWGQTAYHSETALKLTITARMEPAPEEVSTVDANGGEGTATSVRGECNTLPNALQLMEFEDFEQLYREWKAGRFSTEQVAAAHGQDVAELLVTHDLVENMDDDTEALLRPPDDAVVGEPGALMVGQGSVESTGLTNATTVMLPAGQGMSLPATADQGLAPGEHPDSTGLFGTEGNEGEHNDDVIARGEEGETMDADGNAERTLEAGQMSQTGMTDQAHQKTLAADERRKRQADRDEKLKREDEKKGKMAQLSGKNPNLAELERIAHWRAADEAKKQMLEDARTKRELAREQALRDMHETAAKRDELWNRLEATRTQREAERQQNRQKAVIEHIKNMPVGGGLPNVLVY
ncbi:unnamed protein product [Symbiodinium sp. CCMP2592]|nr:unnamed protein product [Symbiodinium sp. CCMP2592]